MLIICYGKTGKHKNGSSEYVIHQCQESISDFKNIQQHEMLTTSCPNKIKGGTFLLHRIVNYTNEIIYWSKSVDLVDAYASNLALLSIEHKKQPERITSRKLFVSLLKQKQKRRHFNKLIGHYF